MLARGQRMKEIAGRAGKGREMQGKADGQVDAEWSWQSQPSDRH